jgi:hypothetical protein
MEEAKAGGLQTQWRNRLWVVQRAVASREQVPQLVPGVFGYWSARGKAPTDKHRLVPTPIINCPITELPAVRAALDDGKKLLELTGQKLDIVSLDGGSFMKFQVRIRCPSPKSPPFAVYRAVG